jgi:hypothetical protein
LFVVGYVLELLRLAHTVVEVVAARMLAWTDQVRLWHASYWSAQSSDRHSQYNAQACPARTHQ